MRFFADSMLGKLCRWLRLMGFDVQYAPSDMLDSRIVEKCSDEDLFLITRDLDLSRRYERSLYIAPDDYISQLREFISMFPPDPELFFSRCPICNGVLDRTDDAKIMEGLPDGIRKRHTYVYLCKACGKIYWEGSHYDSIRKTLATVMEDD